MSIPPEDTLPEYEATTSPTLGNPFIHQWFDSETDVFRLLRLEPGAAGDKIACTLQHFELANPPSYRALSYTWGGSRHSKTILVNRASFQVSENLYDFLELVRSRPTLSEPEFFWIDQICIDLMNGVERSRQVERMAAIYGGADEVVMWLGNIRSEYCTFVFSRMASSRTVQYPPKLPGAVQQTESEDGPTSSKNRMVKMLRNPEGIRKVGEQESYTAYAWSQFMKIKHWKRLWPIQEFMLAKKVTMCMGKASLDWDEINLSYVDMESKHYKLGESAAWGQEGFSRFLRLRKLREFGSWQEAIDAVTKPESGCLTLHDRIYALLGVVPEKVRIAADYTITRQELFDRVCRAELDAMAVANDEPNVETIRKIELFMAQLWSHLDMASDKTSDAELPKIIDSQVLRLWPVLRNEANDKTLRKLRSRSLKLGKFSLPAF